MVSFIPINPRSPITLSWVMPCASFIPSFHKILIKFVWSSLSYLLHMPLNDNNNGSYLCFENKARQPWDFASVLWLRIWGGFENSYPIVYVLAVQDTIFILFLNTRYWSILVVPYSYFSLLHMSIEFWGCCKNLCWYYHI